jgi:hypothetical protein
MTAALAATTPAIVAKTDYAHRDSYLRLTPAGQAVWTDDPASATPFASMKEAFRMASRLPASLRAFSLPRPMEGLAEAVATRH